jgi:hypothetical protein
VFNKERHTAKSINFKKRTSVKENKETVKKVKLVTRKNIKNTFTKN